MTRPTRHRHQNHQLHQMLGLRRLLNIRQGASKKIKGLQASLQSGWRDFWDDFWTRGFWAHGFWVRGLRSWERRWVYRGIAGCVLGLWGSLWLSLGLTAIAQIPNPPSVQSSTRLAAPIVTQANLSRTTSIRDIGLHWAGDCIQALTDQGLLTPEADGRFYPNGPLTRGDFAVMVAQAFADRPNVNPISKEGATRFIDVTAKHRDVMGIAHADRLGFLDRYVDRVFLPDQYLNRWEVWANVIQGLDIPATGRTDQILERAFTDQAAIPTEVRDDIASAVDQHLVTSYPEAQEFDPNATATRGDLASLFCRVFADRLPADLLDPAVIADAELQELRGVWLTNIDSDILFSRRHLRSSLEKLSRLRFNTLYPTVWNWGYTLYPSQVTESAFGVAIDPHPDLRRRDMLADIISESHDLGLRVIPWFEFGFQAPSDSELAQRRPEWLTQKADGSLTRMEGNHERVWLNPFHPEVQQFILDVVVELVRNYDIDGIQFDDHMGLPVEYGYDDWTIAQYQAEHNGERPPADPHDPDWVAWRASRITDFMERLFHAVKEVDNECIISLSPNPQEFAYKRYLQNWALWERMGIIEELVLQLYRPDVASFQRELDRPEVQAARVHIPTAIGILAGLRNRPAETSLMEAQLNATREGDFAGVSFFFYESLWQWSNDSTEARMEAIDRWFSEPAHAPSVYD